jgi:hypothetical protein
MEDAEIPLRKAKALASKILESLEARAGYDEVLGDLDGATYYEIKQEIVYLIMSAGT